MKKLNLHTKSVSSVLELPVEFIDTYLPEAPELALKVYLYLVRASYDSTLLLSTGDMAELFDVTPNKIVRALSYWADLRLLLLNYENGEVSDVTILPLPETVPTVVREPSEELKEEAARILQEPLPKEAEEKTKEFIASVPPEILDYRAILEDPAFTDLLELAEYYLAKPVTQTMSQTLADIYVTMGRQSDIVEYLLEYCIEKNHTSPHYMRAVAEGWKQEGLVTLAAIKEAGVNRNKNVYGVMKAFGLSGREPVASEMDYIKTWLTDFDLPIVLEACHRTMLNAHTPDFRYANAILLRWKDANVQSLKDVEALDKEHEEKADAAPKNKGTNLFNNFPQRNTDYNAIFAE